jgi:hypothetical protein
LSLVCLVFGRLIKRHRHRHHHECQAQASIALAIIHHAQRHYLGPLADPAANQGPRAHTPWTAAGISPSPPAAAAAAAALVDRARDTHEARAERGAGSSRAVRESGVVSKVREEEAAAARLLHLVSLSLSLVELLGTLVAPSPDKRHPPPGVDAGEWCSCSASKDSKQRGRGGGEGAAGSGAGWKGRGETLWVGEGDEDTVWVGAERGEEVWNQMVWEARGMGIEGGVDGGAEGAEGGRRGRRRGARKAGGGAARSGCLQHMSCGYLQHLLLSARGAFLCSKRTKRYVEFVASGGCLCGGVHGLCGSR